MKQYLYFLFLSITFFFMLLFPSLTFSGASKGLLLWYNTLLPTLLPFTIISNVLLSSNCVSYLCCIISPFFKRLFHISSISSYAVFVGFLCGYPMGAKVISDLVTQKRISQNEGQYLLSFSNNTSPMFLISYVITQNLKDKSLLLPSLLILYSSPIICSFIFRKQYPFTPSDDEISKKSRINFHFMLFDQAIMNGFETITKIGGYIILFSILFTFLSTFPITYFISFLEITNGIPFLITRNLSSNMTYVLCMALSSYGGLCSVFQTNSMITNAKLSIKKYQKEKLITAMVTSLFAYVYAYIIP